MTIPTSKLVASITTSRPTEADMYIELPTMSRRPYLFNGWDRTLRDYILTSLSVGFVNLNNASAPNYVSSEVIEAAKAALNELSLTADQITYGVTNYVRFDEERMVAPVPRYKVEVSDKVDNVQVLSEMKTECFMLVTPTGATHDYLHRRLAADGLHGKSPEVGLFNTDFISDTREYERADRLTAALHEALDTLSLADLEVFSNQACVRLVFTKQ